MSGYEKNTDRPSAASVAQVEDPSGTDTHDPFDGNAGGGGGSVDLSAIDQDVTVINSHVIDLQGDLQADDGESTTLRWDSDFYGLIVQGIYGSAIKLVDPANHENGVAIYAASNRIEMTQDGMAASFVVDVSAAAGFLCQGAMRWESFSGPVLTAPDESLHRLIVANDGTLSTEPVV